MEKTEEMFNNPVVQNATEKMLEDLFKTGMRSEAYKKAIIEFQATIAKTGVTNKSERLIAKNVVNIAKQCLMIGYLFALSDHNGGDNDGE